MVSSGGAPEISSYNTNIRHVSDPWLMSLEPQTRRFGDFIHSCTTILLTYRVRFGLLELGAAALALRVQVLDNLFDVRLDELAVRVACCRQD